MFHRVPENRDLEPHAMSAIRKDDEPEIIWVSLPLDLATFAWLASVAEQAHALPEAVGASILRDVREDDEVTAEVAPREYDQRLN
jgi:hypothetical protein